MLRVRIRVIRVRIPVRIRVWILVRTRVRIQAGIILIYYGSRKVKKTNILDAVDYYNIVQYMLDGR